MNLKSIFRILFVVVLSAGALAGWVISQQKDKRERQAREIYFQGKSLFAAGELDRAIELFQEALALNKNLGMAYQMLGTSYDKKGDYQQAIRYYEQGLQFPIDPMEISRTHYNLGVIYRDRYQDTRKAREEFQLSIQTHPPYIDKTFDPHGALEQAN